MHSFLALLNTNINKQQPKNMTGSKISIASTGSDYYAAMFKDGKMKVGSISQYGSALRQ